MPNDIREKVLSEHFETITAVIEAGREVAEAIEEPITDGRTIRMSLGRLLERRGLLEALVAMLRSTATAVGSQIQGEPVAASPYVVVTSRGPLCRGTLADGRRLLVEIELFVPPAESRGYRPVDGPPADRLRIWFARSGINRSRASDRGH